MCLVSTTAFGQSTEIVYSRGDSAMTVGTGITKAETFDLCQCLDDKALVGMRVKALRITFPLVNGLSDGQAWMSTQLPTIKSMKMQPVDIATKEFTPQRGYHEVVFDEPYTITAEGLYVGYTFKLAEATTARKPVVVTRKSSAGGCYIHSSQKYRTAWHDMAGDWNDLALQAITTGFDWVFWLDSDMTFQPDILARMMKTAEEKNIDFLSGLYFRRVQPYTPVAFDHLEVNEDGDCEWSNIEEIPEELFEVSGCGFGCVLIKTSVLDAVREKYADMFMPIAHMGEDLSFCWRARQCGFRIWMDPSIELGHVGYSVINRKFYEFYSSVPEREEETK